MTANPNPAFGVFCGTGGGNGIGQQQQTQRQQQQQQHERRPPHILSQFWNCGPDTAVTATPASTGNNIGSGLPPPPPPAQQRMRNFVDGILSPFVSCVQPPLHSCVPTSSSSQHRQSSSSSPPATSSPWDCSPLKRHIRSPPAVVLNSPLSKFQQQHQQHPPPNYSDTVITPHENDVLCGRGGSSCRHSGNQNFRLLIAANKNMYVHLTKKQKMMVARQIVDLVHTTDPPGRFLAKEGAVWKDIGLPRSLEKTSQALREKSHTERQEEEEDEEEHAVISPVSSDDAIETPLPTKSKSTNRPVVAPVVIIPDELKSIYRPIKDWSTADPSMPLQKATSAVSYMPPITPPQQQIHYSSETHFPTALPPFRPSSSSVHGDYYPPSIVRSHSFSPTTNVSSPLQQPPQPLHQKHHHRFLPHTTPPVPLSPILSSSAKRHSARSSNLQIQPQQQQQLEELPILPMVTPQREVKRQRTNEGGVVDNNNNMNSNSTLWSSVSATANTVSRLSLEDRVIQKPTQPLPSPSRFLQGRAPSRQYYHHQQQQQYNMKLHNNANSHTGSASTTPARATTFLRERSAECDEMAGLTALSTAAFLRLDESLEEP